MHGKPNISPLSDLSVVTREDPELKRLRALVETARSHLAELETAYTIHKAKVDSLQARLFKQLRHYYQNRERLRLIVDYRKRFMEVLLRQGEEEAAQLEKEYQQAREHSNQEYEETASNLAAKKQLTAEEEIELAKLWKKLVNLYHPDRFIQQPDKLETYNELTAAINGAKGKGDLETLRQIASDPHGFILRQGWTGLDFRDEEYAARLQKLWESLEKKILSVLEATNQLLESPEFELYELVAKQSEMFDEVVAKQTALIEKEITDLTNEAGQLSKQIEELTTQTQPGKEFVA